MNPDFAARVRAVPWTEYETAYGEATRTPDQLIGLTSTDSAVAFEAAHHLWCGLCHQHAYVSSAALPALPFLLEVLDGASDALAIELLDILLGFATCTVPQEGVSTEPWVPELRQRVFAELPRFEALTRHADPQIADFAEAIVDALSVR